MRNLKKFLALVMAMVMAFSLMLSASAANTAKDFDDASSITEAFVEATDVLTGMKVFQGDEGGFRPADTITRAEVAALIYRLATGDVDDVRSGAYANYGNFTDVAESDWFAGYVGYCANAGYIKGKTPTTFDPYASVTGYEALAMILRAIGYDKNGEFTGSTWETNVSALATQLGILTNIKTTHYGNTLYLASRRDVVAELLFQADAKVNMVNYTPAFGYQPYGDEGGVTGAAKNPTLGEKIFGLALSEKGVLLGNQQTGETGSVMGYASDSKEFDAEPVKKHVDGSNISWPGGSVSYSAYTWEQKYNVSAAGTIGVASATGTAATDDAANAVVGTNVKFELETGIDLIGHNLKLWYDNGNGVVSNNKKHVYAYFDKAKTAVVKADNTDLTDQGAANVIDLCDAIGGTELKVNSSKTAVFNNSFGKFGTLSLKADNDATDADEVSLGSGDGRAENGATGTNQYASPVKLYKVISNNKDNTVDAVIALNIESSQVTESNAVNRVPTIGVPVDNKAIDPEAPATGSFFVEGQRQQTNAGQYDKNLKQVGEVETGVLAKDALVGNSVSALGDYEMGIHITGTTRRDISANEATAINSNGSKNDLESSYFLLSKVTATVTGKVVAYNRAAGTVTLDNGTVLNRSKFYDTVVVKNRDVSSTVAPASAIPQGWVYDAGLANADPITDKWVEGYANDTYKFYTDYEGKYLGAERCYGSTFLYGTYLDYDQKTSTSTFNYYLTGVTLDGEIETVQISKYWQAKDGDGNIALPSDGDISTITTPAVNINGTNVLGVPFRDTANSAATSVNGLGEGLYTGFAINGDTVDSIVADTNTDRNEHLANMARLGIKYAAFGTDGTTKNPAFDIREIAIDRDDVTLGARETIKASEGPASNKYFTEATKFILVEGFGTDSVKAEVYTGISELKGNSDRVFIKMNGANDAASNATTIKLNSAWDPEAANKMTYYTESPYTYAQSGQTAMKIDTIILPKAAVSWSGGSGLYYVGNPNYSMINSWGTDAWKYDLYEDGELKQVWLTNDPSVTATADAAASKPETTQLSKDTFYNLKDTGKKANDGQPIYTAGNYSAAGVWTAGTAIPASKDPTRADGKMGIHTQFTMSPEHNGTDKDGVRYSAVTRDAQTATFSTFDNVADQNATLYRVAEAKVVNLNKGAVKDAGATLLTLDKNSSGEIWPGITDLATLNEAGSINPVTGRALKVAAVVDPNNPLVVTTIYVCWDQSWT